MSVIVQRMADVEARVVQLEGAVATLTDAGVVRTAMEERIAQLEVANAELVLVLTGAANEFARIGGYDSMVVVMREAVERLGGGG